MELIYIYIKNYRTFQEQKIHLTDKFHVTLDDNGLKIVKNETYRKMFQDNISNINVIVGKNASGKSSLLDLVGDRLTNRRQNDEMTVNELRPTSPSSYISDFFDGNNETKLTLQSTYFMLYTNNSTDAENDIFLFESNNTKLSSSILQSVTLGENAEYFESKSWVSAVCTLKEHRLSFMETTQRYEVYEDTDFGIIEIENIILYFHQEKANQAFRTRELDALYDESAISVGRRYCRIQGETIYSQLELLQKCMNSHDSDLYKNNSYQMTLDFEPYVSEGFNAKKCDFINLKKTIKNYTHTEQFLIIFFYAQLCHVCRFTEIEQKEIDVGEHYRDGCCVCSTLLENGADLEEIYFETLKNAIIKKFKLVLQQVKKTHGNSDSVDSLMILDQLEDYCTHVWDTLSVSQEFFDNCKKYNVELVFEQLKLKVTFTGQTNLPIFEKFLEAVVDSRLRWYESEITMPVHKINKKIQYLSEGEREYLSFFTAIDQQIASFTVNKNKYILLLDEVEQSMHPEMCRTFLSDLMKFLKNYPDKTFQIIISSHSPFLISDLPQSSVIRLEKKDGKTTALTATERTFGQNIHTILKSDFFLEQTSGEYARTLVKEIANYLRRGSKKSAEEFLAENFNISLEEGTGKDFISHVIGEIGEPILRSAFEKMYQKWSGNSATLAERISSLEAELERLKKEGQ